MCDGEASSCARALQGVWHVPPAVIDKRTIDEVKSRADIVAVLSEAVPTLKLRGKNYIGLCPFHREKSPSFNVSRERGRYFCFGCKETGGVIDFVMKQDGLTFVEAVKELAGRFGIEVIESNTVKDPAYDERIERQKAIFRANEIAAAFFEEQLRQASGQAAREELKKRGLAPESDPTVAHALQAFRVGYAPDAWDGLAQHLRQGGISPVVAEDAGLIAARSSGTGHYDRFRHRLMFAVLDIQGRVVAFSGRALPPGPGSTQPADGAPAKYINSPESPVYTKGAHMFGLFQGRSAIREAGEAILVEGNFDVLALHARGLGNVVAPLGTSFTAEQAKLLRRYTDRVIFFFDADAAGKKAVRASRPIVREADLLARVVSTEGLSEKDPDEIARNRGVQYIRDMCKASKSLLEHLLNAALDETFRHADVFERAARVTEVATLLREEQDPLVRSMLKTHADHLAGRLDLHKNADAFRTLENAVKSAVQVAEHRPAAKTRGTPGSASRQAISGALIEYPELLSDPDVRACFDLLEGASAQLVVALRDSVRQDPEISLDIDRLFEQIPATLRAFVGRHTAASTYPSRKEAKDDILENAKILRRISLTEETARLSEEQRKSTGDWDAERALLTESQERVKKKHGL